MSEQREGLAAIIAAHPDITAYTHVGGEPQWVCEGCKKLVGQNYRAHLADVILREWLPGALADERVVEAAAEGMHGTTDARSVSYARAALSAAVTALTEDDA